MNLQNLAEFLPFFFINHNKTPTCHPIILKFGTKLDSVRAHLDIKFGCNTINGHKFISNYSQNNTNMLSRLQGKFIIIIIIIIIILLYSVQH